MLVTAKSSGITVTRYKVTRYSQHWLRHSSEMPFTMVERRFQELTCVAIKKSERLINEENKVMGPSAGSLRNLSKRFLKVLHSSA